LIQELERLVNGLGDVSTDIDTILYFKNRIFKNDG
jgi:hypothetical protein